MAQMVEHILGKDEVTGSIPVSSSIKKEVEISQLLFFIYYLPKPPLPPIPPGAPPGPPMLPPPIPP